MSASIDKLKALKEVGDLLGFESFREFLCAVGSVSRTEPAPVQEVGTPRQEVWVVTDYTGAPRSVWTSQTQARASLSELRRGWKVQGFVTEGAGKQPTNHSDPWEH